MEVIQQEKLEIFIILLMLMSIITGSDCVTPPDPSYDYRAGTPMMCGKVPHFPGERTCQKQPFKSSGVKGEFANSEKINFGISVLSLNESNRNTHTWLHVHVKMADSNEKIKSIAIQAQNILGYPVGYWTTEVPCKVPSTAFGDFIDAYDLMDMKTAAEQIKTVDCPKHHWMSNGDKHPNFLSLLFSSPVPDVYATVKITYWEGTKIGRSATKDQQAVFITVAVVTDAGVCYMNHHSKMHHISFTVRDNCDKSLVVREVPLDCHHCLDAAKAIEEFNSAPTDRKYVLIQEVGPNPNPDGPPTPPYLTQMETNDALPKDPEIPSFRAPYDILIPDYVERKRNPPPTTTTAATTTTTTTVATTTTTTTKPATKITTASKPTTTLTLATVIKTSNTPPPVTKAPDIAENTATEIVTIPKNELYNECEHTKGCMGQPPGCLQTRTCTSIVSYTEESDKAAFQLFGKSGKYIAMGFSHDKLMGHDSVIECVRESGDIVRAYRSFNLLNRNNVRLADHSPISRLKGKYDRGEIYCEFLYMRKTTIVYQGKTFPFDLGKDKYHILYVMGNFARDGLGGNIGYHNDAVVGDTKLGLLDKYGKSPVRYFFEKFHGMTMIFTWFFVFPIGNFLPRYYKETWSTRYIGSYTWWYLFHVIASLWTVFFTLFSSLALAIINHAWKKFPVEWNFHVLSGVAINVLIIFDILLGFAVIKFNFLRYYFINFLHGLTGHVLFFLSYCVMYNARYFTFGMPCITTNSMVAWMVMIMIIHLVMMYQVCYTDFVQGKTVSRVYYSCGTLDLPELRNGKDAPGTMCRKVLLVIMVTICLLMTVILAVLYGQAVHLDCNEDARIVTAAEALTATQKKPQKHKFA